MADPTTPRVTPAATGEAPASRPDAVAETAPPRRWWRRVLNHFTAGDRVVAALAVAVVAYYCATRGVFQGKASGDGLWGFFYLPGLLFHHTFDMWEPSGPFWHPVMGREVTGHMSNQCPIGPIAIWAPTYLVGIALHKLAALVVKLPPEALPGQTPFDFWMAGLGSLFAGLFATATMFRLLARKVGVAAARFAVVGAVAATPIVWYLTNQPLYQHACGFFAVTVLVERWDAWRGALTRRRFVLLGVLTGVAMLMRLQQGVWLLLPGLDAIERVIVSWRNPRELGRRVVDGLCLGAAAGVVFLPQVAVWVYYYGKLRTPQPAGHMLWSNPALVATLFSTRAGLITWSPILYLVAPGFILGRKRLGGFGWRMALVLCITWYVNASEWCHWGSWAFGARRFTDITVTFAAGLAGLYAWVAERRGSRARRGTRALVATLALAVVYNLFLMELVREHRVKSSGGMAAPASTWVKWAQGPEALGRVFDRVGYPFVQPAGWIYAWVNHVPVKTYEGVVGNYVLERDWNAHQVVISPAILFSEQSFYVVDGVAAPPDPKKGWPPGALVPAGPTVRIVVPLVMSEPLRLRVTGQFLDREREVVVRWNDELLPATARRGELRVEVPERLVRSRIRTNMLVIDHLPPGARLQRVDFESLGRWWAK